MRKERKKKKEKKRKKKRKKILGKETNKQTERKNFRGKKNSFEIYLRFYVYLSFNLSLFILMFAWGYTSVCVCVDQ